MSSCLFWHGSPHAFPPAEIRRNRSFIDGVFLTGSPEIAAIYAGPGGQVHGYVIETGDILDASGHAKSAMPMNYPNPETWEWIKGWIADQGSDLSAFDCIDPFKIEHGFVAPLGPEGQPSWEELFEDLVDTDDGHELIAALGCDGILLTEWSLLALNDRGPTFRQKVPSFWADFVVRMSKDGDRPHVVLGIINAEGLRFACTVSSDDIAAGRFVMPRTDYDALEGRLKNPEQHPSCSIRQGL